jgi:hypothetical protein
MYIILPAFLHGHPVQVGHFGHQSQHLALAFGSFSYINVTVITLSATIEGQRPLINAVITNLLSNKASCGPYSKLLHINKKIVTHISTFRNM